jgi:hypothetical protein
MMSLGSRFKISHLVRTSTTGIRGDGLDEYGLAYHPRLIPNEDLEP